VLDGVCFRLSGYGLTIPPVCKAQSCARFAQSKVHLSIAVSGTPCSSISLFRWHSESLLPSGSYAHILIGLLSFRQVRICHPALTDLAPGAAARLDAQLAKLIRFVS